MKENTHKKTLEGEPLARLSRIHDPGFTDDGRGSNDGFKEIHSARKRVGGNQVGRGVWAEGIGKTPSLIRVDSSGTSSTGDCGGGFTQSNIK